MAISLKKITPEQIAQKGVRALANRPNEAAQYGVSGLSAEKLKQHFDQLAVLIAERYNEIVDTLADDEMLRQGITFRISNENGEYDSKSLIWLGYDLANGKFAKYLFLPRFAGDKLPPFNPTAEYSLANIIADHAARISVGEENIETLTAAVNEKITAEEVTAALGNVTADSIGALKKVTTKEGGRAYCVDSNGNQVMRNYTGNNVTGGTLLYREANGDCRMQDPISDLSIANKQYVDRKTSGISSQLQDVGCIEEVVVFSGMTMNDGGGNVYVTISDPTANYVIFDTTGRVVSYTGGSLSELTPNYDTNSYYLYSDWSIYVADVDSGQLCINAYGEYNGTTQIFIAKADKCKTEIGSGITCFIEGTKVLLRDKDTGAVTEKNIEDVEAGDYLAFWSPVKGRLTQTRAIVPPIVGECDKYHRLSFSDGRTVDVFGNQFFWDVDKDQLINWDQLIPGKSRVCTDKGDIITYTEAIEVVPSEPVKHYTLMTFRSRYLANGVQVGDKVELFYPRLVKPEYKAYWDGLTEGDRNYFKRAWAEGMHRRNWRFSEAYHNAMLPVMSEQARLNKEIEEKQAYLDKTDYLVVKLSEGLITEEEFAPARAQRQESRDSINAAREALTGLENTKTAVQEQVKTEILSTLNRRYAGVFAGKTRAEIGQGEK